MAPQNKNNYNKGNLTAFNKDVLKLFTFLMKRRHDTSCIFLDVRCFLDILNLLYEGAAGKTKQKLDNDTNLKCMIDTLAPEFFSSASMFIRKGLKYDNDYLVANSNILLDYIPTNEVEMDEKNKLINSFSKRTFSSIPAPEVDLDIRNQSYFEFVRVPRRNVHAYSYVCPKLKCLFLALPYSNSDSFTLIIKPEEAQLIDFCANKLTAEDIEKFHYKNRKLTLYTELNIPHIELKTEWHLDDSVTSCNSCPPYLRVIFGSRGNFSKISPSLLNNNNFNINFSSSSRIVNTYKNSNNKEIYLHDNTLNVDQNILILNIDNEIITHIAMLKSL